MKPPFSIRSFVSKPHIQALLEDNFTPEAAVETSLEVLDEGMSFAMSWLLAGRWFRAIRARDHRILWCFEVEDDALLFHCRFGGRISAVVSCAEWQRIYPLAGD
jgi:hypothetical protein